VKAGLGISLIPEMAREHGLEEGIVYRSLDGTRPKRAIALAVSSQRKPSRGIVELSKFIRDSCVPGSQKKDAVPPSSPRGLRS
ncbi:MAG: LysR family transcriptional regulator substrate-binding protein, partial [Verrucomicrobia bacterium]|nr:LysR family transcriptional regulator substrate-binding protein [Verrucomicrobiota bacterium]